jgi:IS605 OrfB family transposase
MKTIKLPYKTNEDLTPVLKQYSSIVRYSYNRFLEGKTEKDIRKLTKSLNNIDLLNSWLIQCGIKDGKSLQARFKNEKVIFGGKFNLINRLKNKITKEEYQIKRLSPINIQGEELKQGNRSFKLNIIENNQIIFKLSREKHIFLELPKLRNNIKKELFKIQQLNEVKQNQRGHTYSIRFDLKYIYISFEEFKNEKSLNLNENRCLGIDLNPDTIGISVLENNKVIHVQEFSLKPIFNKILNEKLSSNSDRMKYFQNKLKFETFEISKSITKLAKQFNCKSVFIEDLHFKGSSNIKISNRKNKNLWKRELFINNLTKRLNIEGIKLYSVNPAYSSFIGNMMYSYTDSINASIEIARRGFEYRIKKNNKGFYPNLLVKHQWKEMATKFTDWKEFFIEVKNLKLKYRVSLDDIKMSFGVFQQNSTKKSMVLNYVFWIII